MNPTEDKPPAVDDQVLDLLADGELSESKRRELLIRLDSEPDGWRRCALAFLESQSWRQEFGLLARPPAIRPTEQGASASASRRSRSWGRVGTLLAMAASFLVALWLGTRLRDALQPHDLQPRRVETASSPPEKSLPEPEQPSSPWRSVTLAADGGPGAAQSTIRLPAVERDNLDQAWLQDLPQALPADMLEALKKSGHNVHQQRRLVPFRMDDGRRLVVPVDQVEVNYVGNPAYQ